MTKQDSILLLMAYLYRHLSGRLLGKETSTGDSSFLSSIKKLKKELLSLGRWADLFKFNIAYLNVLETRFLLYTAHFATILKIAMTFSYISTVSRVSSSLYIPYTVP